MLLSRRYIAQTMEIFAADNGYALNGNSAALQLTHLSRSTVFLCTRNLNSLVHYLMYCTVQTECSPTEEKSSSSSTPTMRASQRTGVLQNNMYIVYSKVIYTFEQSNRTCLFERISMCCLIAIAVYSAECELLMPVRVYKTKQSRTCFYS